MNEPKKTAICESYPDVAFIFADGFDDAIIGFCDNEMRIIYSVKKSIEILCKQMSMEEAIEYFEYNVSGSKGEKFPIWCYDLFDM